MPAQAATDSDLLRWFPDLECVGETVRLEYLDFTETMINITLFGAKASYAHALLAAHFLAVSQPSVSPQSPTTSKKIGQISATYAVGIPPTDQELSSTSYGLAYIACRETVFAGPIVAGPS